MPDTSAKCCNNSRDHPASYIDRCEPGDQLYQK